MKKKTFCLILLSLIMVLFPSCKKEAINSPTRPMRITLPDDVISYYEENYGTEAGAAFQTAAQAFKMLYPETYSHLVNNDFGISLECYTSNTLREIIPEYNNSINDTLMYIVNFSGDKGFALVTDSLDILAISDNGNIRLSDFTTRPYLEQYNAAAPKWALVGLINTNMISKDSVSQISRTITYAPFDSVRTHCFLIDSFGPYVSMNLGQDDPYNFYCYTSDGRHAVAGCVPIALASWFSSIEQPEFMNYNYSWEQIKDDWGSFHDHPLFDPGIDPKLRALTSIIAEIGADLHVDYGPQLTTFNDQISSYCTMIQYLQSKGFTNAIYKKISYQIGIEEYLENGKPLYATGTDQANLQSDSVMGHAWVFDGIKHYNQKMYTYEHGQYNTESSDHTSVHCNMGWYGEFNGFYDLSLFIRCNDMTTIEDLNDDPSSDFSYRYNVYVITY